MAWIPFIKMSSTLLICLMSTEANAETWAVWKSQISRPGMVTVAPLGTLAEPWSIDSVWYNDTKGAWKKACWLVRNGDLYGRRYLSSDIDSGKVTCDTNCNCKF